MSDFLNSLENWENLIKPHNAIVDELEGVWVRVKIVTLISRVGKGVVQDHFLWELQSTGATKEGLGRLSFGEETPRRRQLRSARRRSRPRSPTPMEIGMVKGQNGKRQHLQPKGGGGCKGHRHQQTCEHSRKLGRVKKVCWYAKKCQPPSGTCKGKSGQGCKCKVKGKNKTTRPSPSASSAS